jgi:hypothetical protein
MLTKCSYQNLTRIKCILEEFGILSGLVCNVEKTVLLPFGENAVINEQIMSLGFVIADKVTILGLEIDRNRITNSNQEKIIEKIRKQVSIWRPFNLSLPGRISIAKTMLYSQINYLGSIIPLTNETYNAIEDMILSFVKGPLNLAKKRVFQNVGIGGCSRLLTLLMPRKVPGSRDVWT